MKRISCFGMFAAILMLAGCANRIIDFTAISTKNIAIDGEKGPRVRGEDLKSIIIFFPTGTSHIKDAVDRAIESGDGDLLVDGVVRYESWYIPYIFGRFGYIVEGNVMKLRKTAARTEAPVVQEVKREPVVPATQQVETKSQAAPQSSSPAPKPEEPKPKKAAVSNDDQL